MKINFNDKDGGSLVGTTGDDTSEQDAARAPRAVYMMCSCSNTRMLVLRARPTYHTGELSWEREPVQYLNLLEFYV